jgi:putative NADPH-quinone reductase
MRKILIINAHPDPNPDRFCAALVRAYKDGARAGGHEVRTLVLGLMDVPMIHTRREFEDGEPPEALEAAQCSIRWCDHLVIVHPLWLGGAPALLKAFLEQTFRYGFALPRPGTASKGGPLLAGRTARLIVTMGMPALVFRLFFGAFGVRAVSRGVLALSGFHPVRHTYLGGVETVSAEHRQGWLQEITDLGWRGR